MSFDLPERIGSKRLNITKKLLTKKKTSVPFVDEFSRTDCLRATNIVAPEQKLPIQIRQINGVHIDHMNITKAHQSKVLQKLAAKTAGSDHQHLTSFHYEL